MKKINKVAITVGLTATVIGIALFSSILPSNTTVSQAAQTEEAELRFIFTTDIHGQLNSLDYEQGVDYNNGGLARAYDLIMKARNEKPVGNSFTFDVGDVMYDYTTEYIFAENQKEIQPIYKAMSLIGYDAITLGNHDFDYGYEYILNQLNGSGLKNIAVVSNVMNSKTGAYPFLENMLIKRELETTNGKKVEVTIGVIGETIPILSTKTENYTGVLKTEDIVANVTTQAAKLKELGADIVVVLSHSGFGPEKPELNFKNVSYALTKIDDVDVILCGHEHNTFPTEDTTSNYYSLPGVDKKTYLVNGKNIVMASDRGKSIGLVDLTLEVSSGDVEIIDRTSAVRQVSKNSTTENSAMKSLYGAWEKQLLEYTKEVIGELKAGEIIDNFFGLFQDNNAIQLLNDARKSYAMRILNTQCTKYKDYPIIAASTYSSYGVNSYLDYINIKKEITESDLVTIQPYNNYSILYTINGKQLKEWLEWSASAYESTSGTTAWSDATMSELMKTTNLKSLVKEEWLSDWSGFYVFDGVDYTINPMLQPRYDLSGKKISDSYRVHDITYNGKVVQDDTIFILVADKITQPTDANKGVENQAVYKKFYRTQIILSEYIKTLSKVGSILPTIDNNWKLNLGIDYKFIVRGPSYADTIAQKSGWYDKMIKPAGNYNYYSAVYPTATADTLSPSLLVMPTNMEATGTGYEVAVCATDLSGIKTIKYKSGDYDLDYEDWNFAREVDNNTFSVSSNGIYSVYAEDNKGNKIVKKVNIDNISNRIIGVPKSESYTNRKTTIKGTAESGTTVVFKANTGTYETKVSPGGTYSYSLPAQMSGTEIAIYAKEEETNRVSATLTIKVKRTGPNQPSLSNIYNNSESIIGLTNDDDAKVIAIIGENVYVPTIGGKELYEKATEIYNENMNIIATDMVIQDNGKYILDIGPQVIGAEVQLYSIDHLYRVSRVMSSKVLDGAPNVPEVYEISNIERNIAGKVTSSKKDTIFDVYAEVNGKTFQTQTNKAGEFNVELPEQLSANQVIKVYAKDTVNGIKRQSAEATIKVVDIESFTKGDNKTIFLDQVTNRDVSIYGNYVDPKETVYIATYYMDGKEKICDTYKVTADEFGDYSYELSETLPAGAKIYSMVRFSNGDIIDATMTQVVQTKPIEPYLVEGITNSTKKVSAVTDEKCKVTVEIGAKKYTSAVYAYDSGLNAYVYTIDTGRANSGTVLNVYAENSAGKSKIFMSEVTKSAPDSPKVKAVTTNTTTITGSVELFDVIDSKAEVSESSAEETTTETNLEVTEPAELTFVEQTNTKIYAIIGTKIYKGTIDEDGNYKIKIKKQKKGTVIMVWGSNNGGRGPLTIVKVKASKKK